MSVEKFEFTHDGRDICLLDSLPIVYHPIQDFQALTNVEGRELSDLYSGVRNLLDSQFINDAPENIVAKWEGYLNITPKSKDTLDERRFRLLAKLNDFPPYTDRYLENKLTELCGADNFRILREYDKYRIFVELSLDSITNTETVMNMVRTILPANLEVVVQEYSLRHYELANYTHEQLGAYTHYGVEHGEMFE